jgi:hypothetical protein
MDERLPTNPLIGLGRELIALIEKAVDVLTPETGTPLSRRDVAARRCELQLAVLTVNVSVSVLLLCEAGDARGAYILLRSIYEYRVKAAYFRKHPKIAFEQYKSIQARLHAHLSKLNHPTPGITAIVEADLREWRKTAGARDEYSGSVQFTKMAMDLADDAQKKKDKRGHEYTADNQTLYGIASLYAHGDVSLMHEVFPNWRDDSDWTIDESRANVSTSTVLFGLNSILALYLKELGSAYGLDVTAIHGIMGRMLALNQNLRITEPDTG